MKTIEQRLLSHTIEDPITGCWNCDYIGTKNYPQINVNGKAMRASRVAWMIWRNYALPKDLFICHHCDNRRCINPEHLFEGTHQDNEDDKVKKGRSPKGDRNGSRLHPERLARGDRHGSHTHPEKWARGERCNFAKLTEQNVKSIRKYKNQGYKLMVIVRLMNLPFWQVKRVFYNKTWKHVS